MDRADRWLRRTYYRWRFGAEKGEELFEEDVRIQESPVAPKDKPVDLSDPAQLCRHLIREAQNDLIMLRERAVQQITKVNRIKSMEEGLLIRLSHLNSELEEASQGGRAKIEKAIREVHAKLDEVSRDKGRAIAETDCLKGQLSRMEAEIREKTRQHGLKYGLAEGPTPSP